MNKTWQQNLSISLWSICLVVYLAWGGNAVFAQTGSDSGIGVGTTNQLNVVIGNGVAPTPSPTGVSQAPGPLIPIGSADTLTITIGNTTGPSPTTGAGPTNPPGISSTPAPTTSPDSCKKKTAKIVSKSKRILDKIRSQIGRIDNIWQRTQKRINKSKKNKQRFAGRIKTIGRRQDAVSTALASAEDTIKDMKDCEQAKRAGKTFIKKIRKLQSRLESYKTTVEDTVKDVKDAEKKDHND